MSIHPVQQDLWQCDTDGCIHAVCVGQNTEPRGWSHPNGQVFCPEHSQNRQAAKKFLESMIRELDLARNDAHDHDTIERMDQFHDALVTAQDVARGILGELA